MNFKQLREFLFKHTHRWQTTSVRDTGKKKGVGIEKKSLAMSSWNRSNELKINLGLRNLLLHLGEKLKGICISWKLVSAKLWLYNSIFGGRWKTPAQSGCVTKMEISLPLCLLRGPRGIEYFRWKEATNSHYIWSGWLWSSKVKANTQVSLFCELTHRKQLLPIVFKVIPSGSWIKAYYSICHPISHSNPTLPPIISLDSLK